MDLKMLIKNYLIGLGCTIKTDAGIWYVTTPAGKIWDMTVPMSKEEQEQATKNTRSDDGDK